MPRVLDQQFQLTTVASLKPHPRNARTHANALLDSSIAENGVYKPVVASRKSGYILAGHGLWERACAAGIAEIPVVWLDGLDTAQELRIIAADNRTSDEAGYDQTKLAELLTSIQSEAGTLEGSGYDQEAFDEIIKAAGDAVLACEAGRYPSDPEEAAELEETPEPLPDPISRPGDLWVCGRHRVICGDSTDAAVLKQLMAGTSGADMVFTDPPYNVDYDPESRPNGPTSEERTKRPLGKIKNDKKTPEDFRAFLDAVYSAIDSVLKPGRAIYICHADTEGHHFRNAFLAQPWKMQSCLIWKKTALVFGRADYHWMHEPILYGWKEGASHVWAGDRKQTTIIEVATDHQNRAESDTGGKYVHPTQKPVKLIATALGNSSSPGETVIDTFGGSGSTMIAAEKMSRNARLCELDPRFVDVIVRRWENISGEKAVLGGDGRTFEAITAERKGANPPAA